jgi:hypothetical protein
LAFTEKNILVAPYNDNTGAESARRPFDDNIMLFEAYRDKRSPDSILETRLAREKMLPPYKLAISVEEVINLLL